MLIAAQLAVVAVLLAACGSADAAADCEALPGVRPGLCLTPEDQRVAAPEQTAPVLGDAGSELGIGDFEGQVVVLNFWASWCGPCRAEQPDLNVAYEQFDDQPVAFLGVAIQDTEVNAQAHEREFSMPYPSLFDPANAYAASYEGVGPRSIPTTIIIDQQGRVAARVFGTVRGPQEILTLVSRLL